MPPVVVTPRELRIRIGYDGKRSTYWRESKRWPDYITLSQDYLDNCPCISYDATAPARVVYALENGNASYDDTGKLVGDEHLFQLRTGSYKLE